MFAIYAIDGYGAVQQYRHRNSHRFNQLSLDRGILKVAAGRYFS